MKKLLYICIGMIVLFTLRAQSPQTKETFTIVHKKDTILPDMNKAEKFLTAPSLIPQKSDVWGPQPQGIVDENSPWLHVIVPLYETKIR